MSAIFICLNLPAVLLLSTYICHTSFKVCIDTPSNIDLLQFMNVNLVCPLWVHTIIVSDEFFNTMEF